MKPRVHSVRRAGRLSSGSVRWTHILAAAFGIALGALCGLAAFLVFRGQNSPSNDDDLPIQVAPLTPPTLSKQAAFTPTEMNPHPPVREGETARRHRRLGLEALSEEDFAEAARQFALALQAPNPPSDAAELLGLAKSLENMRNERARRDPGRRPSDLSLLSSRGAASRGAATRAAPESERSMDDDALPIRYDDDDMSAKRRKVVASRARAEPSTKEKPPLAEPSGLIAVTTTPPGLIIRVDGVVRDLTPARVETTPGEHEITILSGDRPLIRRQIHVARGQLARVNEDVSRLLGIRNPGALEAPPGTSAIGTSSPSVMPGALARAPPPPPSATPQFRPPPARPRPPPPRGIPRPAVRQVLKQAMPRLRQCYERELLANPELAGQVIARVAVLADGTVEDVRGEKIRLASGIAVACIFRTLRRLRFPQPEGGPVRLTIPLMFEPEESPTDFSAR